MKCSNRLRGLALLCGFALAAASGIANATLRTVFSYSSFGGMPILEVNGSTRVTASTSGWYDQFGLHDGGNRNYIAGICGDFDTCVSTNDIVYRDFFGFNLSATAVHATSASLLIWNPGRATDGFDGYGSIMPTEIFQLHEVHTPLSILNASQHQRVDIFDDLGKGTFYGQAIVSAADNGTWVRVPLNSAALDAINGAAGGSIAFGGSLFGVGPVSSVPEPQTMGLLIGGLGLLVWRVRSVKKRDS
jgi:hypothetical protein